VVNAYLPPTKQEHAHPDNLEAFGRFRRRWGQVATANAWTPRFFDGTDLYGLDLCVGMLGRLSERWPDLGLVLAVPLGRGNRYVAELQARVKKMGLGERVLWLLDGGAYHPIIRESDIFLRPTNTDGFSISIVEAFEYGIPVVASDAVERPAGCLQFRSRDLPDFSDKVDEVLNNRAYWIEHSRSSRERDHFSEIQDIYSRSWHENEQ
jgi:glycosyltransferase involved in cell wall biosynthesis